MRGEITDDLQDPDDELLLLAIRSDPCTVIDNVFFNHGIGKHMMMKRWGGDPWLFVWHTHAKNWVSVRKATDDDLEKLSVSMGIELKEGT